MKRVGRPLGFCLMILVLIAALSVQAVWALEVPPLEGRVNDHAHILSPSTASQLEAVLADLERTDSTQLVVVTIASLDGDSLEDFSIRLAEAWKIGHQGSDNGAILLIAQNDRKIRIEVGYGLEGRLTDLMAGRIIREVIAPQFKKGRFDQGVSEGVAAMVQTVRGEYKTTESSPATRGNRSQWSPGLIGVLVLFFLVNALGRLKRGLGAAAGGVLAPMAGALFFNPGWMVLLGLIPIGLIAGLLISLVGGPLSFSQGVRHSRGSHWGGGGLGGGGFSSGGGGGFSGGGGGFGGGGSSGGW